MDFDQHTPLTWLSFPADTLQEGYDSEEADHSKLGPPGAMAYLAEADPYDGARAAFEYDPRARDAWLKFDCTTVRECQVSTSSCARLFSLSCVFTPRFCVLCRATTKGFGCTARPVG